MPEGPGANPDAGAIAEPRQSVPIAKFIGNVDKYLEGAISCLMAGCMPPGNKVIIAASKLACWLENLQHLARISMCLPS